jgi:hypothetical protein
MGEGERAERNHDGECNVFHSNELRVSQVPSSSKMQGTAPLADTSRYFAVLPTKFTRLDSPPPERDIIDLDQPAPRL